MRCGRSVFKSKESEGAASSHLRCRCVFLERSLQVDDRADKSGVNEGLRKVAEHLSRGWVSLFRKEAEVVRVGEGRLKPASVGVKLAAAKAFYAALRWSGATDTAPFADVRAAVDKTPAWEKRDAYTRTEVHWLERTSEGYTFI